MPVSEPNREPSLREKHKGAHSSQSHEELIVDKHILLDGIPVSVWTQGLHAVSSVTVVRIYMKIQRDSRIRASGTLYRLKWRSSLWHCFIILYADARRATACRYEKCIGCDAIEHTRAESVGPEVDPRSSHETVGRRR